MECIIYCLVYKIVLIDRFMEFRSVRALVVYLAELQIHPVLKCELQIAATYVLFLPKRDKIFYTSFSVSPKFPVFSGKLNAVILTVSFS